MRTPMETAHHMLKTYGERLAFEYAGGYATGMYYEQHESAKTYWRAVLFCMRQITKGN